MMLKNLPIRCLAVALLASTLFACAGSEPLMPGEELRSDKSRITEPQVAAGDLETLVAGNTVFALDMYQQLRATGDGNLFFSPFSISIALAMTYAGALGQTEAEMATALHFDLPQAQLHPAFNQLDLLLASRAEAAESDERPFRLNVANQLFGQQGYPFEAPFLDTLALNYGAGLRLMDFIAAPEPCRLAINAWVEEKTEERIKDLLQPGTITEDARLVLVNAIYFNASWDEPFKRENTTDGAFHLADGSTITVPMMHQTEGYPALVGDGFEAVEIDYDGEKLSMVVIAPTAGTLPDFEAGLTAESLQAILDSMTWATVELSMPRWTYTSDSVSLKELLQALGMEVAFVYPDADFNGIAATDELFISDVLHKAFVSVDEEGTEAAAATAVVMEAGSMPEFVTITLDRPFLYLVRDIETGAILFFGRTVDPR